MALCTQIVAQNKYFTITVIDAATRKSIDDAHISFPNAYGALNGNTGNSGKFLVDLTKNKIKPGTNFRKVMVSKDGYLSQSIEFTVANDEQANLITVSLKKNDLIDDPNDDDFKFRRNLVQLSLGAGLNSLNDFSVEAGYYFQTAALKNRLSVGGEIGFKRLTFQRTAMVNMVATPITLATLFPSLSAGVKMYLFDTKAILAKDVRLNPFIGVNFSALPLITKVQVGLRPFATPRVSGEVLFSYLFYPKVSAESVTEIGPALEDVRFSKFMVNFAFQYSF